jgi:hypothetical protein
MEMEPGIKHYCTCAYKDLTNTGGGQETSVYRKTASTLIHVWLHNIRVIRKVTNHLGVQNAPQPKV